MHALDRHTIDFEAGVDAEVGAVQAGADPEEAGLSAEQATPPAEPSAEPAAPDWTNDPAYLADVHRVAEHLAQRYQQQIQPQYQVAEQPEELHLDPFDDSFGLNLQEANQRAVAEALQPIVPLLEWAQQQQEQQQWDWASGQKDQIFDSFTDLNLPQYGDDARAIAEHIANGLVADVAAQYGNSPFVPQAASRQGAEKLVAFAKSQREAGKQAYIEELKTLSNAPSEPGAGSSGVETTGEYRDELAAARAWTARNIA